MRPDLVNKSKFLSLVLRHDPSVVGVKLDAGGWIEVDVLVAALQRQQPDFSHEMLERVVATNDKRRFMLSDDGVRIRAAQGHSIGVDLGLLSADPPERLFHGTVQRNLPSIHDAGLLAGKRDYVHLSSDSVSARQVGARHGRPVVLVIAARRMVEAGHAFHMAENGVWLTRAVPAEFVAFPGS